MKTYLVLLLSLWGVGALALPGMPLPCPGRMHQSYVSQLQEMRARIWKASVVGEENRHPFDEYQEQHGLSDEEMRLQFSANAEFHCGGQITSASFVLRKNLLVLSAHSVFHMNSDDTRCLRPLTKSELDQCYVKVISSRGEILPTHYPISPASIHVNPNYCKDASRNTANATAIDWAVVELKSNPSTSPDVVPYDLYDTSQLKKNLEFSPYKTKGEPYMTLNLSVTSLSAGALNFKKNGVIVPTICDGHIGYLVTQQALDGMKHIYQANNCSAGSGNSGGAIVVRSAGQRPQLIGIQAAGKDSSMDGVSFGPKNYTAGPLIEGDERDVILACKTQCPLSSYPENISN